MENYEILKEFLKGKRENKLTKEETYMMHALVASTNSNDPSTQVGACYVSKNGDLLSVGCNNNPCNWNEDEFPWGNNDNDEKNTKYPYVIHAEMNGATNYNGNMKDFIDSTIYVTLFPCIPCAKLIASLKVKKLVYLNARKGGKEYICAKILLNRCNIECVEFKDISNIKGLDLDISEDEKNNVKIKTYENNTN